MKFMSTGKARKYLDKVILLQCHWKKIRKLQLIKNDQRSWAKFFHARNGVRKKETIYKITQYLRPKKVKAKPTTAKSPQNMNVNNTIEWHFIPIIQLRIKQVNSKWKCPLLSLGEHHSAYCWVSPLKKKVWFTFFLSF